MNNPFIKGGQGRDAVEVEGTAMLIFAIAILAALAVLIGLLCGLFGH